MSVRIYWASRYVAGIANINHHFALIVWDNECPAALLPLLMQNNRIFITLGGHPSNPSFLKPGNLVFKHNESGDVEAGRRVITLLHNESETIPRSSQYSAVNSPAGSASDFARNLIRKAIYYGQYSRENPISYQATELNSNSWCNALFQSAGVSDQNRERLRNFAGYDAAASEPIPMRYFGG